MKRKGTTADFYVEAMKNVFENKTEDFVISTRPSTPRPKSKSLIGEIWNSFLPRPLHQEFCRRR